jgi:hypothetical protein
MAEYRILGPALSVTYSCFIPKMAARGWGGGYEAPAKPGAALTSFVTRYAASLYGVLSGFDRIRFRGTQRLLASARGMAAFLGMQKIRLKDFATYVSGITDHIRDEVKTAANRAGVPVEYVNNSSLSKEELATNLAERASRRTGLRAIRSAVEPCRTFFVRKNAQLVGCYADFRVDETGSIHDLFGSGFHLRQSQVICGPFLLCKNGPF